MALSIDPSLKVVKSLVYRGTTRFFSNRYYFDNLKPADNTKWTTLADAVTAAEKLCYPTVGVSIVNVLGYDAGSDVPVFSKAYSLAGTWVHGTNWPATGDSCALVRYSTSQKSSKNHPIYLFNYHHGAVANGSSATDYLNTAQRTLWGTYAANWVSGFSDGSVTHHRCGPNGHVATGYLVDQFIRHRDFPPA